MFQVQCHKLISLINDFGTLLFNKIMKQILLFLFIVLYALG
jgi:hypothetical protein